MGGESSKQMESLLDLIEQFTQNQEGTLSQKQFTSLIFRPLNNDPSYSEAGCIMVSDTHVLSAFYQFLYLKNGNRLTKSDAKDCIKKIYSKPEKCIEYTYNMIRGAVKVITRKQFRQYINKCFERGVYLIEQKASTDAIFKKSFKDWVEANKITLFRSIDTLFTSHAQNDKDSWTQGDLERWVKSKDHWFLCVSIKGESFKIPLHLASVFGVNFSQNQ